MVARTPGRRPSRGRCGRIGRRSRDRRGRATFAPRKGACCDAELDAERRRGRPRTRAGCDRRTDSSRRRAPRRGRARNARARVTRRAARRRRALTGAPARARPRGGRFFPWRCPTMSLFGGKTTCLIAVGLSSKRSRRPRSWPAQARTRSRTGTPLLRSPRHPYPKNAFRLTPSSRPNVLSAYEARKLSRARDRLDGAKRSRRDGLEALAQAVSASCSLPIQATTRALPGYGPVRSSWTVKQLIPSKEPVWNRRSCDRASACRPAASGDQMRVAEYVRAQQLEVLAQLRRSCSRTRACRPHTRSGARTSTVRPGLRWRLG